MSKLFVLEGGNQCGKTTLAEKLMDTYGCEYIKCSQPKNAFLEYRNILDDLMMNPRNAVIDRFHLGTIVYGPLYRGGFDMKLNEFHHIEKLISIMNTNFGFEVKTIVCYTDIDFIQKKHKELKEEYLKFEDIEKEIEAFKYAVRLSNLPWEHHDIVNNDLTDMLTTENGMFRKFKV